MKRLAGRTVTGDFTVDFRAARRRMSELFEHEEPRSLSKNEAIAIARERAGALLRLVIPSRGHDSHQLEAANDQWSDRRVRTARDRVFQSAALNLAGSISNGIR